MPKWEDDLRRTAARTAEVERVLDGVLEMLVHMGFTPPSDDHEDNRGALADAFIEAAIVHHLRIRIEYDEST